MSLRFIYGRAGSGKSYFCFHDIKSRIEDKDNSSLILLVPEDYSFQAERDLLKLVGESGLMKAKVLSFKRMAYLVFSQTGGLAREHVSSSGKCILLYSIMDRYKDKFTAFKKSVKMKGFVNIVSDMITELKIYNIDPGTIENAIAKADNDMLKEKLHDIDIIYSEFEKDIHEGYIDSEDDLLILADKLDRFDIFNGDEIWVDGFSIFTPQQYIVLGKLLKKAKRVNVTLCMDCGIDKPGFRPDVFSPIRDIEERILKLARDSNTSIDPPIELKQNIKFRGNDELLHLEQNLFSFPYQRYEKKTNNITIFKALNKYTEVECMARDILSLCRDKGLRFCDIAVTTGDVQGYEKLVSAIFSEYGIPYFFDQKMDITTNPLIVLIVSAIEILYKNWQYESVFRYLKTGLCGIDIEDVDLIENYVLSAGIKGKRWTDGKPWCYWPDYGYEAELPDDLQEKLLSINKIRNDITKPLVKFEKCINDSNDIKGICSALFNFLCDIGVYDRVQNTIEELKDSGQLDEAGEYGRVWNIVMETIDQIVEVLGSEKLSLEQFLKVFSIGIEEYKIGLIPPAIDQVMFGGIERVKSRTIKALYVLGVNDGILPQALSDEGILSDNDREKLKDIGIELAPGTKEKAFDEQYLIYTAFTRPQKYLKISYPIADAEGRAMRPSIMIARLKKVFKNINEMSNVISKDTDEENLNLINSPNATFNDLVCVLRKNKDGYQSNPVWKDVYYWYMSNDLWKDRTLKAMSGLSYVNQASPISKSRVKALYGKNLRFSISRLEKYAQCPFAYFMEYGLKAKERKVYELSPPDLGSFMHIVLDRFSEYLDERNIKWKELDREQCAKIISTIVDSTVDKMSGSILSSSARYKYLKERLKRIMLRAVCLIALQFKCSGFEQADHEVAFQKGGKYPPISICLPSGEEIKLVGRIDRVDMLKGEEGIYVRIIDYKSGNKDFNLSDIYNGLEFQLLIYIDAILEQVSKTTGKPAFPGGILYFKIDEPIVSAEGELTEEEAEKEIMKRLKMRGLLLSDVRVVKEMDRNIKGYSLIIPANIRADGNFGPNSSIASAQDFEALRKHVKNCIIDLCEEMLKGNISIHPYKKRNMTPCSFCSFKPVCGFDTSVSENTYRIIDDKSKGEVWSALSHESKAEGGNGSGMDE